MNAGHQSTRPMNTGGWIARAVKAPVIKPAVRTFGDHSAQLDGVGSAAVVVLHGFTGNAESMVPLIDRLVEKPAGTSGRRALAVDLIGHGATPSPPDIGRYSLGSFVGSLDAVFSDMGILNTAVSDTDGQPATAGAAHIIGYSLGGRAALTYACARPQNCASLTLIGASAGIADTEQRLVRRRNDYALANKIARHGVSRFVAEWTAQPMWHSLRKRLGEDAWQASLAQRALGHPLGLAHSLRGAGAGAMAPLWDKLAQLAVPTLVLAGEEDTKFCEIGTQMAQQIPHSKFAAVSAAGHAAHLEQPDDVASLILAHIGRITVAGLSAGLGAGSAAAP